jgi:hypothetical protein
MCGVCNDADVNQRKDQAMKTSALTRTFAAFALIASFGLSVAEAGAAPRRGQAELINQPGAPSFVCRTDEGYGRWSTCDHG